MFAFAAFPDRNTLYCMIFPLALHITAAGGENYLPFLPLHDEQNVLASS